MRGFSVIIIYLLLTDIVGLRSKDYPTDPKDQQPFVERLVAELIQKVLGKPSRFSTKIWTVEQRRVARGSTDVMIPAVEVTFTESPEDAILFRKGASLRAKSKEKNFEGIYFSIYVGLQTRIRCEVV